MNPLSEELLLRVARDFGTPTYTYSAEAILHAVAELREACLPLNPLVCFAVKANPALGVLKLLAGAGLGADIVSGGELERAHRAGIPGERIVYSGVGKTEPEMALAIKRGVLAFQVESLHELAVLTKLHEKLGLATPVKVSLRINPNIDAKTHPHITTGLRQNKFGLSSLEVESALKLLHGEERLQLAGLSIHIGSQLTALAPLRAAFTAVGDSLLRIERRIQRPLQSVNLGGGLGIRYENERPLPFSSYGRAVTASFGPRSRFEGRLQVILEPGRSLVGSAGVLLATVVTEKVRGSRRFLVLDAGMNDLLRPALYGAYHAIVPLGRPLKNLVPTTVVGPLCESGDVFGPVRKLPRGLVPGDRVAILTAGAYGFSMASNYNSRPRAAEVLIQGERPRLIRRREDFEDLLRSESGLV